MNDPDPDLETQWGVTRSTPLGPPAAPVPYQRPAAPAPYDPPPPVQSRYVPMPPPPPQHISYVQPVARKGLTGPHAAIYITLMVLGVLVVLPVLCCLGLSFIGAATGGGHPYPTP
jgi:hypothetical protein